MLAADLGSAAFFHSLLPKETSMLPALLGPLARLDAITLTGLLSLILSALVSAATLIRHALRAGKPS